MDNSGSVVILTGGTSRRMGQDKATLNFGGTSLVEFVVGLVPFGMNVVMVGKPGKLPVIHVREDPIGGGPVAALHAALPHIPSASFCVIAVDTPFGLPWLLQQQLTLGQEALIPLNAQGRPHYLCAEYNSVSFAHAINRLGGSQNASMKDLVSMFTEVEYLDNPHTETLTSTEVLLDINTPADLVRAHTIRAREWGE